MSLRKLGRRWRVLAVIGVAVAVAMASIVSNGSAKGVMRARSLERAALAALAKPPAPVLPASGKVLGGLTSQHQAVVLMIAKKDKQIAQTVTALQLKCTSGDQLLLPDGWVKLPLTKSGAVSVSITVPPSGTTPVAITGGSDTFSGKLNGKKATFSGKWELKLNFSDSSTGQTDQCDSGVVTIHGVL